MPVREGGDSGIPIVVGAPGSVSAQELRGITQKIAARVSIAALA